PGSENSTTTAYDLGIDAHTIVIAPALVRFGEDAHIEFRVTNCGLRTAYDYSVQVFDDMDRDSMIDPDELVADISGEAIVPSDSIIMFFVYEKPGLGVHMLGLSLDFANDRNPANNSAFKEFSVTNDIGELTLSPAVFSPNNDGYDDRLQIDFRLPEPGGLLTLYVFDMRGKIVHVLSKKEQWPHIAGTVYWNGEHSTSKAQTGMYIVYLEYSYHDKKIRAKETAVLAR
ncbi:unnamed protein product, partial [marine sediment metagenome]